MADPSPRRRAGLRFLVVAAAVGPAAMTPLWAPGAVETPWIWTAGAGALIGILVFLVLLGRAARAAGDPRETLQREEGSTPLPPKEAHSRTP